MTAFDPPDEREPVLDDLAEMLAAVDPVPPAVVAGGRAAFAWRTMDEELARLASDRREQPVGVRGDDGEDGDDVRELLFEAGEDRIAVDVTTTGGRAVVTGQVLPAGAAVVTAESPAGSVTADVDERGRFVLEDVPATAPVRLRLVRPGRRPVVTDWVVP